MQIIFEKVGGKYRKLIKSVYEEACKFTDNDFANACITVSFVNEREIRSLNKEYREVDKVTDVLSFPMLDIKYPQKIRDFMFDISPNGNLYLGDVVICKKVAKLQAKEYGHKMKREVCFLALHGLLHVLGYDHVEKEDEKVMVSTSEEILNHLDIKRGKNV